ncbi:MAG TPA: L-2-hydroxyglutarate oxidase [Anaerolineales bacterium]|nr:L-2-hydroxyglutarate oxidase [Anaerolineales bacterium]
MPEVSHCAILIVGGGITGLTLAREFVRRNVGPILVLEKEAEIGAHASGRNSGVLHAGIYYTPDTLKARFCIEGNHLMKAFCRDKGLTLHETGKVIVTRKPEEESALHELKRRAEASGAAAEIIDDTRLKRIEPYARTSRWALYSPETAVIQPREVLQALAEELEASGKVHLRRGSAFLGIEEERAARTSLGLVRFDFLVNAAGAYADRLAHAFGLGREYAILPFKGTYKSLRADRSFLVQGNIYPVPDLRNPFLGVHFTRSAEGTVYVGPTAIPAFGRENYRRLEGVGAETARILFRQASLFVGNAGFRSAALTEPKRYLTRFVYSEARQLIPSLRVGDLQNAPKVGIRAQLVHAPSRTLVMDFVILRGADSLHILNTVSPAFTSSMAFARHIASLTLGSQGVDSNAVPV